MEWSAFDVKRGFKLRNEKTVVNINSLVLEQEERIVKSPKLAE